MYITIKGVLGMEEERERAIMYLVRPSAGGMRGHVQNLLGHFSRRYRVCLAAPQGEEWNLPGSQFYPLPLTAGFSPAKDLHSWRRFYQLLRKARPNLLHIHGFKSFLIGRYAAGLARVPALVSVHNYPAYRGSDMLLPPFIKLSGAAETHFIAVSHALARELTSWGIAPERITVIHNGIDPEPFQQAARQRKEIARDGGSIVVGTAARMASQKGLKYLIRAAAWLAGRYPMMRFIIGGEGPEQPALQELACRMGLSGKISFPGFSRNLAATLAQIDIFVLPSLTEGMSITILEALAAGCAVVATRVGGVPEVIVDGVTGLLVPPASAGALAGAVAVLADNPYLRQSVALAGRERVIEKFVVDKMLMRTGAVYEMLLARPEQKAQCQQPAHR